MSHPVSQHSQPQRRKLQLRFIVIELRLDLMRGNSYCCHGYSHRPPPSQKRPAAALPQHVEAAPHPWAPATTSSRSASPAPRQPLSCRLATRLPPSPTPPAAPRPPSQQQPAASPGVHPPAVRAPALFLPRQRSRHGCRVALGTRVRHCPWAASAAADAGSASLTTAPLCCRALALPRRGLPRQRRAAQVRGAATHHAA